MPKIEVQTLLVPKAGSSASQCQDAFGVSRDQHRVCVADGAADSYDSGTWARLLCRHWLRYSPLNLTTDQMAPGLAALGGKLGRQWRKNSVPWYAEEKACTGAFSTFLGLSLSKAPEGLAWNAVAIGDSCVIHRSGENLQSFPLEDSSEFNLHPILLPSDKPRQHSAMEHVVTRQGTAEPGDTFLLLTDSMALWYLSAFRTHPELVAEFESALAANELSRLKECITLWRSDGILRNDDIAAVRVFLVPPPSDVQNRDEVPL